MINKVEEFPGQIKQLEDHIAFLEKENSYLKERVSELEAKVYGGNTK